MTDQPLSKDELIQLFIDNKLRKYAIESQQVKPGEVFRLGKLFHLTTDDIKEYLERKGYPPFEESGHYIPPHQSDNQTCWSFINGEYCAIYYERDTTSTEFCTRSREEFQDYWNRHRIKVYEVQLSYPWKA
jgi:hypothetical protein